MLQRTLKDKVKFKGIGLHTGCNVTLELIPANVDTGIIFRRVDLNNFLIEAKWENVEKVFYATSLMKKGVYISTVEHLLSALYALKIDNLYIDIDNMEVPILDGSSRPFVEEILKVGIEKQNKKADYIEIFDLIEVHEDDKFVKVLPYNQFKITYEIDFPHPEIKKQKFTSVIDSDIYFNEISHSKTFGFLKDIEFLKKNGLIRGGNLENAIVLSDTSILNREKLKGKDDFVKHKVLDFIGDISLLGKRIKGHFIAYKSGHKMHTMVVKEIVKKAIKKNLSGVKP